MRKLLILITITIMSYFIVGCNCADNQEVRYKWQVEVTFLDGTVEVMDCIATTYQGNECMLELTDNGSLRATLKGGSIHHNKIFANGVRTFKQLSEEKTKIISADNSIDGTHTQIPQQ